MWCRSAELAANVKAARKLQEPPICGILLTRLTYQKDSPDVSFEAERTGLTSNSIYGTQEKSKKAS